MAPTAKTSAYKKKNSDWPLDVLAPSAAASVVHVILAEQTCRDDDDDDAARKGVRRRFDGSEFTRGRVLWSNGRARATRAGSQTRTSVESPAAGASSVQPSFSHLRHQR